MIWDFMIFCILRDLIEVMMRIELGLGLALANFGGGVSGFGLG